MCVDFKIYFNLNTMFYCNKSCEIPTGIFFFYSNEPWQNITAAGFTLINMWGWTSLHMTDAAWLKCLRWIEIACLSFFCVLAAVLLSRLWMSSLFNHVEHIVCFGTKWHNYIILFVNGMRDCKQLGSVCVWSVNMSAFCVSIMSAANGHPDNTIQGTWNQKNISFYM